MIDVTLTITNPDIMREIVDLLEYHEIGEYNACGNILEFYGTSDDYDLLISFLAEL